MLDRYFGYFHNMKNYLGPDTEIMIFQFSKPVNEVVYDDEHYIENYKAKPYFVNKIKHKNVQTYVNKT